MFLKLPRAVGLGTKPSEHEQLGLWLATLHIALGPQGLTEQGFLHLLPRQASLAEQSSSEWHPKMHMLYRQIWPKKQSLSTRQVTEKNKKSFNKRSFYCKSFSRRLDFNLHMQLPFKHFSLKAQSLSPLQAGKQMLSLHTKPSEQSKFESHGKGTKNTKTVWVKARFSRSASKWLNTYLEHTRDHDFL